jgi:hypothetical protein
LNTQWSQTPTARRRFINCYNIALTKIICHPLKHFSVYGGATEKWRVLQASEKSFRRSKTRQLIGPLASEHLKFFSGFFFVRRIFDRRFARLTKTTKAAGAGVRAHRVRVPRAVEPAHRRKRPEVGRGVV